MPKSFSLTSNEVHQNMRAAWPRLNVRVLARVGELLNGGLDIRVLDRFRNLGSEAQVTFVCIVHDRAGAYMSECFESIRAQSDHRHSLVVVNNGANAGIANRLTNMLESGEIDVLVTTPRHAFEPQRGDENPILDMWNLGALLGSGKYFFCLNPDDFVSPNYVSEMLRLLEDRDCVAAAPLVVPVLEDGSRSLHADVIRDGNQQFEITKGSEAVLSIMGLHERRMFARPGGLLCARTDLAMANGGLDSLSDHTLFFKVGIFGTIGYSPDAHLFWRYHPNQANTLQAELGLVYYREYAEYPRRHSTEELLKQAGLHSLAQEIEEQFGVLAINNAQMSLYHAFGHKTSVGLRASIRLIREAPIAISSRLVAVSLLRHIKKLLRAQLPRTSRSFKYATQLLKRISIRIGSLRE